jgi:hypothetical protein
MADLLQPVPMTPTLGQASQAAATDWVVDDKSTVSGQMTGLMAADSPYMQQAQTMAAQAANSRGLINSSMAVGAGTDAAIRSALPIAQQDAGTFANSGQWNAGNKTQNSQFNAGQNQQMTLANTGAQNNASQFNAQSQNAFNSQANDYTQQKEMFALDENLKKWLTNTGFDQQKVLANMDYENKTKLASIEANYKTLMQTSDSASNMYQDIISKIAAIAADDNMDATSKSSTINALQNYLKTGLTVLGSINGIDVGSLLTFG